MSPQAKLRAAKIGVILSFFIGVGMVITGALRENIVYYKTPSEVLQMKEIPQKLRLGGLVVKGSLTSAFKEHQFIVTDNAVNMRVEYVGRLPDLFREGQGVVAVGRYNADSKCFIATQLLVKHDQYYRPKEY